MCVSYTGNVVLRIACTVRRICTLGALWCGCINRTKYKKLCLAIFKIGNGIRESGNRGIRESGNRGIRELGNPGIGESGNWGTRELGNPGLINMFIR